MAETVSASDVPHDHYDSSSSSDLDWKSKKIPPNDEHDSDEETNSYKYNIPERDELYNPNGDEEDEAFVYHHLRGGSEETITIRRKATSNKASINTGKSLDASAASSGVNTHKLNKRNKEKDKDCILQKEKLIKPRSSDAILSCPCCFQIVCMDCQRHEQFSNQFRAMFVMNIGVAWNTFVIPEGTGNTGPSTPVDTANNGEVSNISSKLKKGQRKIEDSQVESNPIPVLEEFGNYGANDSDEKVFHSVHCNNCLTEVAALDMTDEVYHFFGCLVSS